MSFLKNMFYVAQNLYLAFEEQLFGTSDARQIISSTRCALDSGRPVSSFNVATDRKRRVDGHWIPQVVTYVASTNQFDVRFPELT